MILGEDEFGGRVYSRFMLFLCKGVYLEKSSVHFWKSRCGHAPRRAAMTEEKCECQRIAHGRELHNQLAVGVKKRKESRVVL